MLFIEYPKCSTCKKARKFLEDKKNNFETRNIVLEKLTIDELDKMIMMSGKDVNKFFNTSGIKYRELGLKDKLKDMSYEDKISLLSSDGMLVKRPILVYDDNVLLGFKQDEWDDIVK